MNSGGASSPWSGSETGGEDVAFAAAMLGIGQTGTRVRLFPQPPFLEAFREPEVVVLSPPAGSVGPGPSDDRMYAVLPQGKRLHYGIQQDRFGDSFYYQPPWTGEALPQAVPDANGHFDHLAPGTPQFEAAHLYGSVRFVLDVWEGYFGRRIGWHFERQYDQMELSVLPGFDNAMVGWGFIEVGGHTTGSGEFRPFSLNFDVVAHEVGHAIIYREVGIPTPATAQGEYYGFHESAADLVALLASMHFDSVIDHVLEQTRGNLYALNKLNRFAELTDNEQIRMAANDSRLADFARGWDSEHDLGQPLTGAMFDILVDVFHEQLLDRGLIAPEVEDLSDRLEGLPEYEEVMQAYFDEAFERSPQGFKESLLEARDYVGTYLADTLSLLDPHFLDYTDFSTMFERVDRDITGGRYGRIIRGNFAMRDIGFVEPGPRLSRPGADSHAFSERSLVPEPEAGAFRPHRGRRTAPRSGYGSRRRVPPI